MLAYRFLCYVHDYIVLYNRGYAASISLIYSMVAVVGIEVIIK